MATDWIEVRLWGIHGRSIYINTNTGFYNEAKPPEVVVDTPCGYAVIREHALCAVYAKEEHLFLFISGAHIQCHPGNYIDVDVQDTSPTLRCVSVRFDSQVIYKTEYRIPDGDIRSIDSTFDALDDEMSDFWVYLSRNIGDSAWRKSVAKSWSSGHAV
jgi:hypothetical protein